MTASQNKPKAVVSTNLIVPEGVHNFESDDLADKSPKDDPIKRVIYIDDRVIPGAFYVEAAWAVDSLPREHPEHAHDFDEICGFVGSNMADTTDLGGEVDFSIDGKKMTITKTCFIFIPAGVKHGGLNFRKINKPVFQIAMSPMKRFVSDPPT
jgi:hypothetical protein